METTSIDQVQVTGISNVSGMALGGKGVSTTTAEAVRNLSDSLQSYSTADIIGGMQNMGGAEPLQTMQADMGQSVDAPTVSAKSPKKDGPER
jgi:hypothetical protein